MENTEKSGRAAGWLLRLAMKLPGARDALRRLLLRDGAALFREALWQPLLDGESPEILFGPRAEGLAALLARDNHALLKVLLFENGQALFNTLAGASDGAALKALLFGDGYRVLKGLLALRGHEALKAVMLDGDPESFAMIARARQGEPLAALLFEDDAALLRQAIHLRGAPALRPALNSLNASDRRSLLQALLFEGGPGPLELLARMPEFQEEVLGAARFRAMAALLETYAALRPLLQDEATAIETRFRDALLAIDVPAHVRGRILDAITEGNLVRLAHGALRFPDRHAFWTQLHEILLHEDYFFECESSAPRVIDGGAHMGMAIYYFKSMYPDARITAFEPAPALRALAEENVARNGWRDIEILPYALAGERRRATFHVSETWSMAGSLSDRRAALGEALAPLEVECVPLSDYLREPVDFLKLDIEGAEDEVLKEAAPWLHNVRNLFCEFHDGPGLAPGRLGKIIAILEGAGFAVHVGKSNSFQETSRRRPLEHVGGAASMVIWGRRGRL